MTCLGPNTTTVGGFVQDGGIIATGTNASGGLSLMARHTSSVMRFYTASTTAERMRIDASGNVGIGTNNPDSIFHIGYTSGNTITALPASSGIRMGFNNSAGRPAMEFSGATDAIIDFNLGNGTDSLGRIAYSMASDFMTFNTNSSERVRIISSGNVGIGTTNPVALLTINTPTSSVTNRSSIAVFTGTAAASETIALTLGNNAAAAVGNTTSLTFSTASNYDGNCKISAIIKTVGGTNEHDLAFFTRSTTVQERMRILGNGNIGIGTTDPSQELHIYGTNASASGPHIRLQTASDAFPQMQILAWQHDAVSINFDAYFDTVWRSSDIGSNFNIQKLQDKLIFQYDSGITAGSTLTWEQGIVLDATGNVGIGTSTPAQKLSIRGADSKIELRDTNGSPTIDLLRGGGTGAYGASAFADWRIQVPNADPDFTISSRYNSGANGGEWVRINFDNGNVGIGTTNPLVKLHVLDTATTSGSVDISEFFSSGLTTGTVQLKLGKEDTTGNTAEIKYTHVGANNALNRFGLGFAGTEAISIVNNSGRVGIGTLAPGFLLSLGSTLNNTKLGLWDNGIVAYGFGIQAFQFRLHLSESAARFSFLDAPAGNERMTIKGTGNVGIGTTDPSSTLQVSGGIRTQVTTLTTGTHTLDGTHSIIRANTTGGSITINLPAVASSSGAEYKIIKVNASNTVTIDANSTELIDGTTTNITLSSIRDRIFLVCDGTEWYTF
jgi:hypothetical protein